MLGEAPLLPLAQDEGRVQQPGLEEGRLEVNFQNGSWLEEVGGAQQRRAPA